MKGIYAPVQEEVTSQECEVVGELPEAVFGEFARNGPNPRFTPKGGYHWYVAGCFFFSFFSTPVIPANICPCSGYAKSESFSFSVLLFFAYR